MIFVETAVFTRQILELLDDEAYAEFQQFLALYPDAGVLIPGCGGLRKIRIRARGRGKQGGARVIYYHFARASRIALLLAYAKHVQDDLTPDQKKVLVEIIGTWRE